MAKADLGRPTLEYRGRIRVTTHEMRQLLDTVRYPEYKLEIVTDMCDENPFLQASYPDLDIITEVPTIQVTRKWRLSTHMVKSEIIQTAFKCIMTSMEHRVREHFTYKGQRIFGPHFNVDALHALLTAEETKRTALDYRREGNRKASD